jgi:putative spermidine/putrescine transport system substrate-binding protein
MKLRVVLLAGLFAFAGPAATWAQGLTVALKPGTAGEALRRVYIDPFAATGAKVDVVARPATALLPENGRVPDVVQLGGERLLAACQAGQVQKLNWQAIGGRDRQLPQGATDCGLGAYADAIVLSWDRAKFPGTPTWQDFWDIAKVPGKRGLRRSPRGTLEIALLADGVAPADVYRVLATKDGVERAFRRLDQLQPYIVWWTPGKDDAVHLLGSGAALMSSAPVSEVVRADRTGGHSFGVQWNGGLVTVGFWAIPKDAPDLANAERFLTFAGEAKVQAALPEVAALGPLAKGANTNLAPDMAAVSATANNGTLFLDETFWRDHGAQLQARFDAWLAH